MFMNDSSTYIKISFAIAAFALMVFVFSIFGNLAVSIYFMVSALICLVASGVWMLISNKQNKQNKLVEREKEKRTENEVRTSVLTSESSLPAKKDSSTLESSGHETMRSSFRYLEEISDKISERTSERTSERISVKSVESFLNSGASQSSLLEVPGEELIEHFARLKDGSFTILLCDDEAIYRELLKIHTKSLVNAGCKIRTVYARNGEEAVELYETEKPDLVIMDFDLGPGLNGLEATEQIRTKEAGTRNAGFEGAQPYQPNQQNQPNRSVLSENSTSILKVRPERSFICMHSNRIDPSFQEMTKRSGVDVFLAKPMTKDQLKSLVFEKIKSSPQADSVLGEAAQSTQKQQSLVLIDDCRIQRFSWASLSELKDVLITFESPEEFLDAVKRDSLLMRESKAIVIDQYFKKSSSYNGTEFAAKLRAMGYKKPLFLCSDGDFSREELEPSNLTLIPKHVKEALPFLP